MNYIKYMQNPDGPLSTNVLDKSINNQELLDQNIQKALQYVPGLTQDYYYQLQDLNSDNESNNNTQRSMISGRYDDIYNTVTIDPNYNTLHTVVHELEHAAQDQYNDKRLDKILGKINYFVGKLSNTNSEIAKKYYKNRRDHYLNKYKQDQWYNNAITKKLNKLFDFNIREVGSTMREASSTDWQGKSFKDLINTNGYYDDIMKKYYQTLANKLYKVKDLYDNRLGYYSNKYYKEGISDKRRDRIYDRYQHLRKLQNDRNQIARQRHDNKYLRFFKRFNNL